MAGILLAIFYAAVFIFLIWKINFFRLENLSRKWIAAVFILKIFFGTVLWFIYTYFYTDRLTADIFKYFDDGKIMYEALFVKPTDFFKMLFAIPDVSLNHYYIDDMRHWNRDFGMRLYNENRTLIRFNAFVDLFSFGNYHVHTVFISFFSLCGLTGIYKSFLPFLQNKKKELFAIIFLLPSVLFWGSGVIKESLVLFSLGMSVYYYFKLLNEKFYFKNLLFVILFLFLLSISKLYVLFAIVPALAAHFFIAKTNYSFAGLKYLVVLFFFSLAILFFPKYNFPFMIMDKQAQAVYMAQGGSYLGNDKDRKIIYISPQIENRIIKLKDKPGYCKIVHDVPYVSWDLDNIQDTVYVKRSSDTATHWIYNDGPAAGSKISVPSLKPTFFSVLKNSPQAFFITLFRPHLLEGKNFLTLFAAAENFFIAAFIFLCLIFFQRKNQYWYLIFFCLTFSFLLFALIGLTTPVAGSIVRYKIPALPFLLIAFLLILDKEKLLNKFPFLKKFLA